MTGVTKSYPGVVALSDYSPEVRPGEVIGLVGENGAGKSTLMKILGGVTTPDRGTIEIDGVPHHGLTVSHSMSAGIAFVHQELNLFDNLDVAANVFIGREPTEVRPLQHRRQRRSCMRWCSPTLTGSGPTSRLPTPVSRPSLAQRQMVEIAKALSLNSRLVILDEPTSSLPIAETDKLLKVIAGLKAHGIAVIFVSHRLNEVVRGVRPRDRAAGRPCSSGQLDGDAINHDAMVKLMVGRDLKVAYAARPIDRGDVALSVQKLRTTGLSLSGSEHRPFTAARSWVLPVWSAPGRTELARAIFGIDRIEGGTMMLDGEPVRFATSADAVKAGVFLVPEDRKAMGLLLDFAISENITLPNLGAYARGVTVSREAERVQARKEPSRTRHPHAECSGTRRLAFRRQPAEGRARQVAGDESTRHHLRRADPRHRRRRQVGNLPPHALARRRGRRGADDLLGHGGGDRRFRSCRSHAPGAHFRCSRSASNAARRTS